MSWAKSTCTFSCGNLYHMLLVRGLSKLNQLDWRTKKMFSTFRAKTNCLVLYVWSLFCCWCLTLFQFAYITNTCHHPLHSTLHYSYRLQFNLEEICHGSDTYVCMCSVCSPRAPQWGLPCLHWQNYKSPARYVGRDKVTSARHQFSF